MNEGAIVAQWIRLCPSSIHSASPGSNPTTAHHTRLLWFAVNVVNQIYRDIVGRNKINKKEAWFGRYFQNIRMIEAFAMQMRLHKVMWD